jgi:hypothetical protein
MRIIYGHARVGTVSDTIFTLLKIFILGEMLVA